jgi:hypothetical protein
VKNWRQLSGVHLGQLPAGADAVTLAKQDASGAAAHNAVLDLFRALYVQADQEDRVALLNNYWQLLWRASRQAGIVDKSYWQRLDATMGDWWNWKQAYNGAVLRRWIPFTRAWGDELDTWSEHFGAFYAEAASLAPAITSTLTLASVDPTKVTPDDTSKIIRSLRQRTGELLGSPLFWPVVGTVGALVAIGYGFKLYKT